MRGEALVVLAALCLAFGFSLHGQKVGFSRGVAASQPEIELLQEMVERGCE